MTVPPTREAEFVPWLTNIHDRVVAEVDHFGVPAGVVTTWTTAYNAFMAAYAIAIDPETRTRSAIQAKDTTKKEVTDQAREVIRILQGMPTVTDAQRELLQIPIYDTEPTNVPPPQVSPGMELSVMGLHQLGVRIWDPLNPDSKRKPAGVQGTVVFSCTGEAPLPAGDAGWVWQGQTTRLKGNITLPSSLPGGTKVWVCGVFYNAKGEHGPVSTAVSAYLPMTDAQPIAA